MRRRAHPLVFITNAIETPAEHADKLTRLGLEVDASEIVNSALILVDHLRREMPGAWVFPIGDPPLLEQLGPYFQFSEDPAEIDVVVASMDRAFDYRKLNIGFQALRRGARFWATNADPTWPVPEGQVPDVGAIIGALEACTGRTVEVVAGKPSSLAAQAALERLGRPAHECLIIGDSLRSDIALGKQAGMTTALVLTGVTARCSLVGAPIRPDHVLESIAGLERLLDGG